MAEQLHWIEPNKVTTECRLTIYKTSVIIFVLPLSERRGVSGCAAPWSTFPAGPDQEAVLYPSSSWHEDEDGGIHRGQGPSSRHCWQTGEH